MNLKPRRNNPDILDIFGKSEPFQVIAAPINTAYVVNIDEDFESVKQFENVVRVLDSAQRGDILEIKLSTNGGALHAILPLLASMQSTQAQVVVHAVSDVASAGTLVLLAADDVYINPYVTVMFHQVQFGSAGAGSSVEAHVNHTMKSSKALLRDMYKDFFTDEEIEQMLAGRDFYMGKEEFDERYDKRHDIRQARLKAAQERMQALQEQLEAAGEDEEEEEKPKKRIRKPKKVKLPPPVGVPDEE